MARAEDAMRAALRAAATVHAVERTVMLRAFGKVLGMRGVALGLHERVDPSQFIAAWKTLGVSLGLELTHALFGKYGHDQQGRMSVLDFTDGLLMGASRLIMEASEGVQHGAYLPGRPATHTGKIQYPECKPGVWPPSDWDPRLAERSARLPSARLALEFVHGYDGLTATSPNLYYTASGEVVYYVAAVCVVYNADQHQQRFFLGHDDDILCLALHPNRTTVASGQFGKDPCVIVWDSTTCTQLQKLQHGYGYRGIQAAAFSPDGSQLATIGTDNSHTLFVWDWRKGKSLMERKTTPGVPPSTYGVVWSEFESSRLITYGQNHIKFWLLGRNQYNEMDCKTSTGTFGKEKTHTIYGACFLSSGIVLTGSGSGSICSWNRSHKLYRNTPAHACGPKQRRPDGTQTYGGVRCLVLQSESILLSGGADGMVIKWDVSSGDLGPALQRFPLIRPDHLVGPPPALRALDCLPNSDVFMAGTSSCDVWEVDADPRILVYGQQGDLYGLATNPAYPHVYATVCDSDKVMVWSAETRKPIRICALGLKAQICTFSPDGQQLAIGMANGGIKVLEFMPDIRQVWWGQTSKAEINDIRYSPCGRFLAAASHDQHIYIYDVQNAFHLVCRCTGHSSVVLHIDWSADSRIIQSNDQAYEICHFDAQTGKRVGENQRDTRWASWTCTLGFDVMGIWPAESTGWEVNSVHRSPSGRFLLTADDHGHVKLFNYPVVVQHAPAHCYKGHSSFVMNVRWAADEAYAISVGGKDRAILQWRVVEAAPQVRSPGPAPWAPVDKEGLMWRQQQQRF